MRKISFLLGSGKIFMKFISSSFTYPMEAQSPASHVKEPVRMLLAGAIDYAGLFPPSAISMPEAVINYAMYRNSNFAWMLGRFIVTTARIDEFIASARDFISRDAGDAWRVSAVAGTDVEEACGAVEWFNSEHGPGVICDMIEIKAETTEAIEKAVGMMPEGVTAYFELPPDERLADLVATLAVHGQNAKIRTGGVTPEAFPTTGSVIRFVKTCLAANVPFKATAGLHHPIRCFRPLTYEADAVKGTMHGFLNLFMMTGFAREGYRPSLLEDLMEEEFEEVFSFDEQKAAWRNEYELSTFQIDALRKHGIQSFGSCSFDEPVADLQKLGIL